MADGVLSALEYVPESGQFGKENAAGLNREKMLEYLRQNPGVGTELLSYPGVIYYMGESSNIVDRNGRSLGVKMGRGGIGVVGDNVYGEFLMLVREAYREELNKALPEERRVRPGQVVVDYYPDEESRKYNTSHVEMQEANGKKFIHTEKYRPARFSFDAAKDGTTGHNRRESDSDVPFQTFECPFGLGAGSKIRVDSAVEVSLYYEKALRGEMNWQALFKDLKSRGIIVNMPAAQEKQLISDLEAQFDWMREQILRNRAEYADRTIVSELNLIPDSSFGRSVYDPDLAPSPAHILARYINNPHLLVTNSENGVFRALETLDKNEAYRFSAVTGKGTISIVIDGSDTIGGRVPRTRAVREKQIFYKKDERGKFVYNSRGQKIIAGTEDVYKLQFKSKEEIDVDYEAFSSRLMSIVSNISPEVKISFITGTGVGVPQMVHRFIQENGGKVFEWDYEQKGAYEVKEKGREVSDDARFSQLRMPNFNDIQPVLVSRQESVSFLLHENDDDSQVMFSTKDGLSPKGYVSFSVGEDSRNRDILHRGSLAADAGLPLIHVTDNRTEEDQQINLAAEVSSSRSVLSGEMKYSESIFDGNPVKDWKIDDSTLVSFMALEDRLAIPYVCNYQKAAVYVNSVPFHTVFGAYTALMAKESGIKDIAAFQAISRGEDSMSQMVTDYEKYVSAGISDDVAERCMRNSVHMMSEANEAFAYMLLDHDGEFVMPSSFNVDRLFTDLDGKGENRFGIVFAAERDSLKAELEVQHNKELAVQKAIEEENAVKAKTRGRKRAQGEKMSGGLPENAEGTKDAIWFLGTARPGRLQQDEYSVIKWEEGSYGKDALNREIASRQMLYFSDGTTVENNSVFLFPSDLEAVYGKRRVANNPDGRNLTGLTRVDPKTGKEFVCAFGIPVKKDNQFFELNNKFERACSFMLDHDSTLLINGIIEADSQARLTAIEHGMNLCYGVREKPYPDGQVNDDMSRIFIDQVWDYPRTKEEIDRRTGKIISEEGTILPVEVKKRFYNRSTRQYEYSSEEVYKKTWVPNPHKSSVNREIVRRYESMLDEGVNFPLNCICLPKSDYSEVNEEKFLADFTFALKIANAAALSQNLPMRFPLDENGRLDLGPDVPEQFRDLAERKLDSFIGVVREENILNDELPYIRRVPIADVIKDISNMKSDGTDLFIKPLDLVQAFGGFDFKYVKSGVKAPLHEMTFVMDDGTSFKLTSGKLTSSLSLGEINRYLKYDRNDEQRFTVKSTAPERIPEFIMALKSYVERAKRVKVETRLVSETEIEGHDYPMAGFVHLLASNSDEIPMDEYTVSARGADSAIEAPNRFDGSDNDSPYYGKEAAKDSFSGYAQVRCTLPDGTDSGWHVITDRELALDVIYSSIMRQTRSDVRELPSERVLEAETKAFVIDAVGDSFRKLSQEKMEVKEDSKVVQSERVAAVDEKPADKVEVKPCGRIFVTYYGSKNVPEDAVKVQISTTVPEGMEADIDFRFRSLMPDYKTMVGPHKDGVIDDAEYTRRYREKVLEGNRDKIFEGIKKIQQIAQQQNTDAYLYCYCKPGDFCHRYLVNNFLNENGIVCQENPADRQLYENGRVALFGETRQPELFDEASLDSSSPVAESEVKEDKDLVSYSVSKGGYKERTTENAQAEDVDFTFQFKAVDSFGEKRTEMAAGDSCVTLDLPVKDGRLDLSKKAVASVVKNVTEMLPEEFFDGLGCGVNIAGNGLYTLKEKGFSISQDELDVFVSAVFIGLKEKGFLLESLRSGGQTGVDETAAAVGNCLNVPVEIHAPKGWGFRSVEQKDVFNDEQAFKSRFDKNYGDIRSKAEALVTIRSRKKAAELKH